jgi:nitrogen fixation NifU-like protein
LDITNKKLMDVKLDTSRYQLMQTMGYSDKALAILDQNLNMGTMDNPSITEQHQGSCGDIMILSLKIKEDVIQDAKYEYIGCAGLQVCASTITELVKGKTFDQAGQIDVDDILAYLGGIPEKKHECAEIARDTLRKAINSWRNPALKVI